LNKFIACAALACALIVPSTSLASGNSKPQTQLTVGNCISDVVYGNEPNMANGAPGGPAEQAPGTKGGNVLPTQSPGPWVNNPSDPDNPTRGRSVGQFNQDGINIPAACRTALGR
jgi:hypothetical protein